MRLRAPNFGKRWEKAFDACIGWPLAAIILILLSPLIAFAYLVHLKRKAFGPYPRWTPCFAWHPVPIKKRSGWITEWYWLERLEYRAFDIMSDVQYRVPAALSPNTEGGEDG